MDLVNKRVQRIDVGDGGNPASAAAKRRGDLIVLRVGQCSMIEKHQALPEGALVIPVDRWRMVNHPVGRQAAQCKPRDADVERKRRTGHVPGYTRLKLLDWNHPRCAPSLVVVFRRQPEIMPARRVSAEENGPAGIANRECINPGEQRARNETIRELAQVVRDLGRFSDVLWFRDLREVLQRAGQDLARIASLR
jgi:hypothetical protein